MAITTLNAEDLRRLIEKAKDTYSRYEIDKKILGMDTRIVIEVFTVITSNNGDNTFTYRDPKGKDHFGEISPDGYMVFRLQKGQYILGQNKVSIIINDTLHRTQASGGLAEISKDRVALTSPVVPGTEVTITYYQTIASLGLTGSIPYISDIEPDPEIVTDGFLWVDTGV